MTSGFAFLFRLSELCRQELTKRGLKNIQANSEDPVSVPSSCGKSRTGDSYCAENHRQSNPLLPEKCDNSEVILNMARKNLEEIPTKTENPENSTIESEEYHCTKCNYFATSHSEYVTHALSCSHVGLVRCLHCTESVKAEELENHIKSIHLTLDIFERQLDGLYHCTKCNESFKYLSKVKIHVGTLGHKGMDRCRICRNTFLLEELEIHQRDIHGKIGDDWVCKVCGLQYSSKMCLDRHVTSVHERKEQFKCLDCGATFGRADNLRKHQALHIEIRPFACCFCDLAFKTKETLKGHIYNIHFKGRYQCPSCYRGFDSQSKCDTHVKAHHEGLGYLCMVCGEGFKTYSKRERHFTIHLRANNNKTSIKRSSSSEEESNTHPNLHRKKSQLSKATKRGHPQKYPKPLVEGDNLGSKTDSFKSKKNMQDSQVTSSTSRKRKIDVRENCENETPNGAKRHRSSKNVVSEMSTHTADKKINVSESYLSSKASNLVTCKPDRKESSDESIRNGADEHILGSTTNANKLVKNSCRIGGSLEIVNSGNEQVIALPVSKEDESENESFCECPDYAVADYIDGEANPVESVNSLRPCSTIPETTFFIDVNNLPEVDNTIDSFSSLRPDSSITESTLVIDIDNIPQYESIDIIDLIPVDGCPVEVECFKVEADDVAADDALADVKVETGSVACSDSQDVPPLLKVPAKKKATKKSASKQTSKRRSKSQKYPESGKKVIVKNLFTDGDDFVLPEFLLEDDDE